MARNAIVISIIANAKQAQRELESTATSAEKMAGRFSKMAVPAAAVLTGIGVGAKRATDLASDAEQSLGATESVFKEYADTVVRRSKDAADAVGLSANEYRELANVTGAMLKNSGAPLKEVADLTDDLTTRAADLAATYGGSTKDAVEAVGSLLRGEADPIEKYGVSIKQADINARMAADGLTGLEGDAKKQAEQQTRLTLLFEQTGDAAGQFAREADTLAGKQQRAAAEAADLSTELGTALLPITGQVTELLRGFLGVLAEHPEATKIAIVAIAGVAAAVLALSAVAKITTALTLLANPIGLVIAGIALLAAGLVYAYKKSETFRAVVDGAFAGVKKAAEVVVGFFTKQVPAAIGRIIDKAQEIGSLPGKIGGWFGAAKDAAVGKLAELVSWVAGIPGRILGALGNLVRLLWQAGVDVIAGLISGITDKAGELYTKVTGIADSIMNTFTSVMEIFSPSRRAAREVGAPIVQGIAKGMIDEQDTAVATGKKVAGAVIGSVSDELALVDKKLLFNNGRLMMLGLEAGLEAGGPEVDKYLTRLSNRIQRYLTHAFGKDEAKAHFAQVKQGIQGTETALRAVGRWQAQNNQQLKDARQAYRDLRAEADAYANSLSAAVVATGDITTLGLQEDGSVSGTGLLADLRDQVREAERFQFLIEELRKKGLNQTSIDQLLAKGVEGGLQTAEALASGGQAIIRETNWLTTQLTAAGNKLGTQASQAMYGAGLQTAAGLVKGLKANQQQLDQVAARLGRQLIRAVKRSLGINSPSKEGVELGENFTASIGLGVVDDLGGVRRAAATVADVLTDGFGSPEVVARLDPRTGLEHRAASQSVEVTVVAPVGSNPEEIGRELQKMLDAYYAVGGRPAA